MAKKKEIKDVEQKVEQEVVQSPVPQFDMESLIAQITKQVRLEVEKEFEEKLTSKNVEPTQPIYKTNRRKKEEYDFDLTDKVPVKNVSFGGVGYVDARGRAIIWNEFNDITYISIEEVINMQSSNPKLLQEPKLMVLDEEIAEYLGMTEVYNSIGEIEDLGKFLTKDVSDIEGVINKLPEGYKKELANEVFVLNEAEQIDSGIVKRMLQRVLKVDLGIKTL